MIAFFKSVGSAIAAARAWLTLLAVAAAAAWLYVQFATVERERDWLRAYGDLACSSAGSEFAPEQGQRGIACLQRIRALAAFERDTSAESARILAAALADQNAKTGVDAAHARRAAEASRAAAEAMERAENDVQEDDLVGAGWFDALGAVAGLRAKAD